MGTAGNAGAVISSKDGEWTATGFRASRLLAGDSARWQDGALDVVLDCIDSAVRGHEVLAGDDGDFAAAIDARWRLVPGGLPVAGCRRADGNWRYAQAPLQLVRKDRSPARSGE